MPQLKNEVDNFLEKFSGLTENLTAYLNAQPEKENDFKLLLKQTYDFTKQSEHVSTKQNFTLSNLVVHNFDSEQIWQQIELQNQFISKDLEDRLSNFVSNNEISSDEENVREAEMPKPEEHSDDDLSLEDAEEEEIDESDMGEAHDEEDEDMDAKSDESIDYFQDIPSDDENENLENKNSKFGPWYNDFFEDLNEKSQDSDKKRVRFNLNENFEMEEEKENKKSTFEERQERLRRKVDELESEAVSEKPWQMIGEINAKKRPKNSLLEHNLEFDLTARPAPVITETVALKLEEIIIQRIKDKSWDDVERKIKPVDTPFEFKMKLTLDQSKSKMSLAEIYEKEYLKQKEAADPDNKFKEQEEPKEHKQIKQLMDALFVKLDALSNYHYTPRPTAPELKIITNLPAVTMEEAIPVVISDATLLAPEEIQAKKKGELIGKEERTSSDKKRDRRHKKLKQRQKKKETEKREKYLNKLKPGMGNKYSKEKVRRELEKLSKNTSVSQFKEDIDGTKSSKSSKQFFERLQETVSNDHKFSRSSAKKN